MEYQPLGDLNHQIRNSGVFEESIARSIAEQILQGVFVLHELKFIHRDIKPEVYPPAFYSLRPSIIIHVVLTHRQNIIIVSRSPMTVKLADFGHSKAFGDHHSSHGAGLWTAPEQHTGIYNEKVDMWSVGCIVYFLLTALNPFCDQDDREIADPTRKYPLPLLVKQYTFPFWPRLRRHKFNTSSTKPRPPGDQILVPEVSNTANDFLKHLIVRKPSARMSAHEALKHTWICRDGANPLNSALEQGDLPLSRLLAKHDRRYNHIWEESLSPAICQIVIRVAAANGHYGLVTQAMCGIPTDYEFTHRISGWPVKPALVGAATIGNLRITEVLCANLQQAERSDRIRLEACQAALHGSHSEVADYLWQRISDRDRVWGRQVNLDIARYGTTALLEKAIQQLKGHNGPCEKGILDKIDPGSDGSAYEQFFSGMVECAAEHGNINNVEVFSKTPPSPDKGIPSEALLKATRAGHFDVVMLLIGCYPVEMEATSAQYKLFSTALTEASFYGHIEVARSLVTRGVVPTQQMIDLAAERNYSKIFQYLLETLIHAYSHEEVAMSIKPDAVPHCGLPLLKWLCLNRLDRSLPGDLVSHVRNASRFGDVEVVKWLLEKAHGTEDSEAAMSSAFVGASEGGHVEIVSFLCSKEIDINVNIKEAWKGAAKRGHIGVLEILLSKNPTPTPHIYGAALEAAVERNCLGAVMQLLCARTRANGGRRKIPQLQCQKFITDLVRDFGSFV